MKLIDLANALHLDVKAGQDLLEREVTGGYAGDLLSDVLANSKEGNVWITLHTHVNIVAVASARELAGIIIVNRRMPEAETLRRAEEEGMPIMVTSMSTYEAVCRLYDLGVK
jgi:hypothetical protein